MIKGKLKSQAILEILRVMDKKQMERNNNERNIQVKPDSVVSVSEFKSPEAIRPEKDLKTELITEMKEAIEWYMDNTTVMSHSRSYHETFFNLGMNLRVRAEEILKTK